MLSESAGSVLLSTVSSVEATRGSLESDLRGQMYVALGDSISAGYDAPAINHAFPALIARDLGMSLVLLARSGTRAAWGVERLPAVVEVQPRLVTIELGTNDVGFTTPLDAFAQQYEAIVAGVSGPSTRVVCIDSWLPSPPIKAIIRDTCLRHGGIFVSLDGFYGTNAFHAQDGGASVRGPNRADWFHPSSAGHAAIAQAVVAALLGRTPTIDPSSAADGRADLGTRRSEGSRSRARPRS